MTNNGKCVVFLDIDGVLVPVSPMSFGGGDIETVCVQRLRQIVDLCGGKDVVTIVISSTWRHDEAKKERLNRAFDAVGGIPHARLGVPDGTIHPPTVVTYLKKDPQEQKLVRDRVDEILEWLDVNQTAYPEAHIGGRWFAIDDMNLGVDPRMKGHFLKTDTEEGILSSDVAAAQTLIATLAPYTATAQPPLVADAQQTAPAATVQAPDAPSASAGIQNLAPPPPQVTAAEAPPATAAAPAVTTLNKGDPLLPGVEYWGVVKRYNPNRGFGFVTAPNGEDVFLHQSMILHQGFRAVNVGEMVAFKVAQDADQSRRRQAIEVKQLTPYVPTNIQRQSLANMALYSLGAGMMPPDMMGMGGGHPRPWGGATGGGAEGAMTSPPTYLGPGTPGRGLAFQQMPLIPDGMGYRAVNGTVFFPPAATTAPAAGSDAAVAVPAPSPPSAAATVPPGGSGGAAQRKMQRQNNNNNNNSNASARKGSAPAQR